MKLIICFLKKSNSHWLLLFLLITPQLIKAQKNLVPNSSFETYTICPHIGQNSPLPSPWYQPTSVNYQDLAYYNACCPLSGAFGIPYNYFGSSTPSYQLARTGNAYSFISAYDTQYIYLSKLYIQVPLTDSLLKNKKYYCEFFVSLVDRHKYGSNNVGMLLTKNAVYVDTLQDPRLVINANPQILNYNNLPITDTQNWVKISGIFKAQGGEKFITLGNFKDNLHNTIALANNSPLTCICASYYLDDVSVIPLDSFCLKADAGRDTTIKVGDSIFIGSYTNGIDTIKWYNSSGQLIDSTRPGFWYTPNATGTSFFILQQTVNGCFSSDTIYINTVLPLKFISYSVISTKQKSVENVWTTANEINVSHYNIQRSINGKDFATIGTIKANNKASNEYTFTDDLLTNDLMTLYYRIESIDKDGSKLYSTTQQITIKPQTPNSVSIYPNPTSDIANIQSIIPIKEIKIINQLGQTIQQLNNVTQHQTLNTKQLAKGLYIVQVTLQNGSIQNQKIIIQ